MTASSLVSTGATSAPIMRCWHIGSRLSNSTITKVVLVVIAKLLLLVALGAGLISYHGNIHDTFEVLTLAVLVILLVSFAPRAIDRIRSICRRRTGIVAQNGHSHIAHISPRNASVGITFQTSDPLVVPASGVPISTVEARGDVLSMRHTRSGSALDERPTHIDADSLRMATSCPHPKSKRAFSGGSIGYKPQVISDFRHSSHERPLSSIPLLDDAADLTSPDLKNLSSPCENRRGLAWPLSPSSPEENHMPSDEDRGASPAPQYLLHKSPHVSGEDSLLDLTALPDKPPEVKSSCASDPDDKIEGLRPRRPLFVPTIPASSSRSSDPLDGFRAGSQGSLYALCPPSRMSVIPTARMPPSGTPHPKRGGGEASPTARVPSPLGEDVEANPSIIPASSSISSKPSENDRTRSEECFLPSHRQSRLYIVPVSTASHLCPTIRPGHKQKAHSRSRSPSDPTTPCRHIPESSTFSALPSNREVQLRECRGRGSSSSLLSTCYPPPPGGTPACRKDSHSRIVSDSYRASPPPKQERLSWPCDERETSQERRPIFDSDEEPLTSERYAPVPIPEMCSEKGKLLFQKFNTLVSLWDPLYVPSWEEICRLRDCKKATKWLFFSAKSREEHRGFRQICRAHAQTRSSLPPLRVMEAISALLRTKNKPCYDTLLREKYYLHFFKPHHIPLLERPVSIRGTYETWQRGWTDVRDRIWQASVEWERCFHTDYPITHIIKTLPVSQAGGACVRFCLPVRTDQKYPCTDIDACLYTGSIASSYLTHERTSELACGPLSDVYPIIWGLSASCVGKAGEIAFSDDALPSPHIVRYAFVPSVAVAHIQQQFDEDQIESISIMSLDALYYKLCLDALGF